ncbi:hypothetical protein BLS_006483 [Venturia inaequalis]|uniref:High-affinity nicotinic acid transporter n=1 Tax=Venturia inaequalis TaxID=5025 RepID=A0A8H3Z695_VENIN|nr:hypothetical protein BLS_006483 [Venturia inaequalis]
MSGSDLGEKAEALGRHEVATEKSTGSPKDFAPQDGKHGSKKTKQELIAEIDARATAPGVTRESFNHIDEKKLLRKMDLKLLPILILLYLLSFIDRGNIGNAKIEGLAEDLKLTGGQYNWCLTAFFLIYCAAEPPSNIILKRIKPSIWLPGIMGIVTVLVAIAAFFLVHDFPETATFLTEEERAFVVWRLKFQSQPDKADQGAEVAQNDEFSWKAIGDAFKGWQIYVGIIMFWGIVAPLYGISLFLPTIIKGLGYKTTTAQLLTVPVYVFASAIALLFAWLSDRAGKRTPFILPMMFVILVGYIMCISSSKPGVVYAGIFIAAAGVYGAYPGNIALISNNLAGSSKRAAGMAIHIAGGNLSGAMASNFYRARDSPRYVLGHGLEIGFAESEAACRR